MGVIEDAILQKRQAGIVPGATPDTGVSGRGGFLTSLISEGGAAAGAGVGTAILPGIGTIAGAGLGALLGRLTENKVRDDEFNLGSALGEAALSAGTASIMPAYRGFKAVKGAKALGQTDDLLRVFTDGFKSLPAPNTLAKGLDKASKNAATRSFRFKPSQMTKFKDATGVDIADFIKSNKLVGLSPDDIDGVLTKFNQTFGQLADDIGEVSVDVARKNFDDAIKPLLNSSNLVDQRIGQLASEQADEIITNWGKHNTGTLVNRLKGTFDAQTSWASRIANPDRASVSSTIGGALRNTVREASGDDVLKELGKKLQGLNLLQDFAQTQANLGRGSLTLGLTDLLAIGGGGAIGGVPGGVGGLALKRGINSRAAQSALSSALSGASTAAGKIPAGVGNFGSELGRQLLARTPGQLTANQQPQTEEQQLQQIIEQVGQPGIVTQQQVDTLVSEALLDVLRAGGTMDEAQEVAAIIPLLIQSRGITVQQPDTGLGSLPPGLDVGTVSAKDFSNAMSGLQAVDTIEQMIMSDPNVVTRTATPGRGLPVIGGYIANATDTADYDAQGYNIADTLLRIRTGAQANESEIRNLQTQLMPRAGDTPEVIQQKLDALRQNFNIYIQLAQQGA